MIARPLWFIAGAGAGVYTMVRARRLAEAATLDGLRDRLGALGLGARLLVQEAAHAQVEREIELRERFGLPADPALSVRAVHRALPSASPTFVIPATTAPIPTQQQEIEH